MESSQKITSRMAVGLEIIEQDKHKKTENI